MPSWFRRRRARSATAARVARPAAVQVARVELGDLRPDPDAYLGRCAYLVLALFENVGRAIAAAPTTEAKTALSGVASPLIAAHEGMVALLRERGRTPSEAMEPFSRDIDEFHRRTAGQDWYEILTTCYITQGFLVDFFDALAGGLPEELRERVTDLLEVDDGSEVLVRELREALDGSPRLASRLAMWGRRLVGDTMLVARAALAIDGAPTGEERIEPVFTGLMAEHTRRMDALGLTA
ncbi:ferritin-like fold-containing protein [Homoserinibacter sp. YIM 151385]|uniref:ferritin-like fold-containing protein n=1 Tax=Homoserinibacter sp. YIM 151385 TaxID=2985506 RepID=UPI0022F03B8D|nr:ferritin-like fold-containing protein [Homoserinibacter sp. YIM 151385]WBU38148.1 ferritin-like fold-containing protein [Homoserinibacter sp. YIM 151385]